MFHFYADSPDPVVQLVHTCLYGGADRVGIGIVIWGSCSGVRETHVDVNIILYTRCVRRGGVGKQKIKTERVTGELLLGYYGNPSLRILYARVKHSVAKVLRLELAAVL